MGIVVANVKDVHDAKVGDTITIRITCKQKHDHNKHMIFDCLCTNQDSHKVISGEAEVLAPTEKIKRERYELPEVTISDRWSRYHKLIARSKLRSGMLVHRGSRGRRRTHRHSITHRENQIGIFNL